MNNQAIGQKLAALRAEKLWTQEQLAEHLAVSRQAVSKWETGRAMPDLALLLELSKLYGLSINEILEANAAYIIKNIEELTCLTQEQIRQALKSFSAAELVLASKGVSPVVNALLETAFPEIDFKEARDTMGRVRVSDIEAIHARMVAAVNQMEAKR